ncbi:hypothetical protein [Maribacter hydrothermalis]|uniref:Fibronectin type-III domain-containing protein n=1 Tax=Maribacter hydrothermalis TaxID=1836467 RepID=A0A1B7Z8I5_9FLAO|nr:hypothetical protein [Maribacter hydrothermalis]APQ18985.1 hypothetical protein BTR34_17385 [Maribacter hydrothermalis]OBR39002.1 hypothetical protein A9200_04890 [Maribacter hydrothermalis]
MIYKTLKYFTGLAMIFVCLNSCDKSTSTETEKQLEKPIPTKATGTLPVNGEPCSEFELIQNDDTKVSILFKWNAAQNAINYELMVLLGNEQVATTTVGGQEATVTLDKGKTYTWNITSKNENGNTVSDTYSFTTPGLSDGNYAPYVAEITTEFDTVEQILNISWLCTDEDGDDLLYDVVITENETIIIDETDYANTSILEVDYNNDTSYTIKVISKDSTGNFSLSEISVSSPE